jgi:Domain of unknown function (DUF4157)
MNKFPNVLNTRTPTQAPAVIGKTRASVSTGNVSTLFRSANCTCDGSCPTCQKKSNDINISQPADAAEIEADQVADKVMRMPTGNTAPVANNKNSSTTIQRKCNNCEEDEKIIQRKPISSGSHIPSQSPSHVSNAVGSGGRPLGNETRNFFEPRMDRDFGSVRIHTNSSANHSAQTIDAKAYTLGNNIVFGSGEYKPESESGRHLIAHELAHVVQQMRTISSSSTHIQRQRRRGRSHTETEPRPALGRCHPVQDDLRPTASWATLQAGYQARCETATSRLGGMAERALDDVLAGRAPRLRGPAPGARDTVDCACAHGEPMTVAIAAMARVIAAGPLAARMFHHFLGATGTDQTIDVADMISRDSGVRAKILRSINSSRGRAGTTRLEQSNYSIADFQFAFGAIDCVQWRVADTAPRRWRSDLTTPVEISMLDYYEFHPARRAASQCAHAACVELVARGEARNFWTRGAATVSFDQLSH